MAEIKTGIFAKNVQKRLNRAQEKVLQKLGKADETKDEQFEQVVINFKRQESEGSRLQREMKAYMAAIKGMQQASINLTESLHEVYEPDWHGKDDVMIIGKDCDALWEDFHNKLVDSTLLNLDAYLLQFPDLKTRVSKRSRKLIDYDSARHHMETLQASGMRNDRKMIKAEEELKKAQKVFDELNVGLQDELPTLWDSRVGFYVNTFKNVTSLEAKFHREISLLCKQLYEVMTKLGEQHSDKMFTIQGAPSDSGPLRLARTPSPPDDETPPESPDASSNHMLRPVSPGPPRPKSPSQVLKKGPPVPPPPKVTPTKEVAQEQIIDLFGGEFLPAPSPSQPNERPGESLLDLDFDAFQPDESVSPIPQVPLPFTRALPWDMWSANAQPTQPATDAGFVADWSADFGSGTANGDTSSVAPEGAATEAPPAGQDGAQGSTPADGWQQAGDATTAPQPQDSEAATAAGDEVTNAFNGFSQDAAAPSFFADFDKMNESSTAAETSEAPKASETEAAPLEPGDVTAGPGDVTAGPGDVTAGPGDVPADPGDVPAEPAAPPAGEAGAAESPSSPKEEKSASTVGSPVEFAAAEGAELDEIPPEEATASPSEAAPLESVSTPEERRESPVDEASEKMPIPSVVIEPASSNEGDDDRDADIISPTAISDNGVTPENQVAKDMASGAPGLPDSFMYKVETMHDFDAANSDELELKRGDVVLVVPTALAEDQDAGWLTGIKESDWLTLGVSAQRGLFPENFTQRLE
uniref:amphiphysin n=1 Tax=Centroberyx gerrardi TaxID=166262 RepID=UPI003AAE230C